ncbi:MAG: transposase [Candidatus Uhrbacteria bacterium]
MANVEFYNEGFFHIYNRGVDKRTIFLDNEDRERFLLLMKILNDANFKPQNSISKIQNFDTENQKPYVRIMCYALMPNHYHFLVEQLLDEGVSLFMGRLGNAYTKYFNEKHERSGRLFESSFKAKGVKTDNYLLRLTRYIHLNLLDLIFPGWKTEGVADWSLASTFLDNCPWSSYQHYIELHDDKIIDLGLLKGMIPSADKYQQYMQEWTDKTFSMIHPLAIE